MCLPDAQCRGPAAGVHPAPGWRVASGLALEVHVALAYSGDGRVCRRTWGELAAAPATPRHDRSRTVLALVVRVIASAGEARGRVSPAQASSHERAHCTISENRRAPRRRPGRRARSSSSEGAYETYKA